MTTQEFQLILLPARTPSLQEAVVWLDCYRLWEKVWSETLRDLDGLTKLHSDGFVSQDFVAVLMREERVAGFCCFKAVNLRNPAHTNDSWFAPFPRDLLERLSQNYFKGLVPSWLTIHPDFRRTYGFQGPNITALLSEIMYKVCLDLGAQICFGTPRKDRSVHRALQDAGAVCLLPDVRHHGVLVDLMAFIPEGESVPHFSASTLELWRNKRDFRNQNGLGPQQSIWEVPFENVI